MFIMAQRTATWLSMAIVLAAKWHTCRKGRCELSGVVTTLAGSRSRCRETRYMQRACFHEDKGVVVVDDIKALVVRLVVKSDQTVAPYVGRR
jgi:adenine/guanine phosphoribosyltransferase-like PRPP-binding protein